VNIVAINDAKRGLKLVGLFRVVLACGFPMWFLSLV
jgi:hypothetical protein